MVPISEKKSAAPTEPSAPKRQGRKPKRDIPADTKPKGRPRKERIVPKFIDAEIGKMIRKVTRAHQHERLCTSTVLALRLTGTCSNRGIRSNTEHPLIPTTYQTLMRSLMRTPPMSQSFKSRSPLLRLVPSDMLIKATVDTASRHHITAVIKCPDCMGKPKVVEDRSVVP